jgi:hypothetical protein
MTMLDEQQIREAVFLAIEQAKSLSLNAEALITVDATVLIGEGTALDSMGFVNFTVALEEELSRMTERPPDFTKILDWSAPQMASISTAGQLINFLNDSLRALDACQQVEWE